MNIENAEAARERAGLVPDYADTTFTRMVARDGSIWPLFDTGFRFAAGLCSGVGSDSRLLRPQRNR